VNVAIRAILLGALLLDACEANSRTLRAEVGAPGDTLAIDSLPILPNLTRDHEYTRPNSNDTLRANRILDDSLGFAQITQLAALWS
jgi:hypothetical protein